MGRRIRQKGRRKDRIERDHFNCSLASFTCPQASELVDVCCMACHQSGLLSQVSVLCHSELFYANVLPAK